MAFSLGAVIAEIKADVSGFREGMNDAKNHMNNFKSGLDSMESNLSSFRTKVLVAGGAIAAGIGLIGKSALDTTAQYEQSRIAFESMLGSAEKAKKLMTEISDFAVTTPFELPQLVDGAKRLLAYNTAAEDIIPTMEMLGNVAAGVGTEKMPQLILAYGQVQAATKLTGAELRQFSEAGVPLLEALVNQYNEMGGVAKKLLSPEQIKRIPKLQKEIAEQQIKLSQMQQNSNNKNADAIHKLSVKIQDQRHEMSYLEAENKQGTAQYDRLRRSLERNVTEMENLQKSGGGTSTAMTNLQRNLQKNIAELNTLQKVGPDAMKRVKVTAEDMIDMISDNEVKFEDVKKALSGMTGEGGKFFDLMNNQSQTFSGVMSNLRDQLTRASLTLMGMDVNGDIREGSLFALAKQAAEGLLKAVDENMGKIQQFADYLVGLVNSEKFKGFLKDVVDGFISFGKWVKDNGDKIIIWVKGFAIAITGLLIASAVATAIAALTNPINLIIIGISALYVAWKSNFLGMRDAVINLWNNVVAFNRGFMQFIDNVVNGAKKLGKQIIEGWLILLVGIPGAVIDAFNAMLGWLAGVPGWLAGWGRQIFDAFLWPFREALNSIQWYYNQIRSYLDFTQRHSPSVLDTINNSVRLANKAFEGLQFTADIVPNSAGIAASLGINNQASLTHVTLNLPNAIISDEAGARRIGELVGDSIIRRVQSNVRV